MLPRAIGRVGVADVVTLANAAVALGVVVLVPVDVEMAVRLLLVCGVLDALDGVIARLRGPSPIGHHLDALADVAAFGIAPAAVGVQVVLMGTQPGSLLSVAGWAAGGAYVIAAVLRLALYATFDADRSHTEGAQTTLAATILAAGVLIGFTAPVVIVGALATLSVLMLVPVRYPDLHAHDAVIMGGVQIAAIVLTLPWLTPGLQTLGEGFTYGLLFLSLGYLSLSPWFYWG
jgi:CDP-diacylglycerol--serine O-phosphatidyltransferase